MSQRNNRLEDVKFWSGFIAGIDLAFLFILYLIASAFGIDEESFTESIQGQPMMLFLF